MPQLAKKVLKKKQTRIRIHVEAFSSRGMGFKNIYPKMFKVRASAPFESSIRNQKDF